MERQHRPAPRHDRALRRRRRRPGGDPLRPRSGSADLGPRRRALGVRSRGARRRADDRPLAAEVDLGRPGGAGRAGCRRRALVRARPGDGPIRTGHHRWIDQLDRNRWGDAVRWLRPPDAQTRPDRGQPAGRRSGHRRRQTAARRRCGRTGTGVGIAGRWWQFRHRHRPGVRPASRRTDGLRRADLLVTGPSARRAAVPAGPRPAGTGRPGYRDRGQPRSPDAVHPAGALRHTGIRAAGDLVRGAGRGRAGRRTAAIHRHSDR